MQMCATASGIFKEWNVHSLDEDAEAYICSVITSDDLAPNEIEDIVRPMIGFEDRSSLDIKKFIDEVKNALQLSSDCNVSNQADHDISSAYAIDDEQVVSKTVPRTKPRSQATQHDFQNDSAQKETKCIWGTDLVSSLKEIFPDASKKVIEEALRRSGGDREEAAVFMSTMNLTEFHRDIEQRELERAAALSAKKEEEAEEEKKRRAVLLRRFDERAQVSCSRSTAPVLRIGDKVHTPQRKLDARLTKKARDRVQVRFHNNEIVSRAGEKYITEPVRPEDPSTYVSLRIKTKGKRGPGWR